MKRILSFALLICLLFSLAACSKDNAAGSADWQEQYNLGIRYLADGKYEEAILAFTAAIDIDPKQAEAYIGRAEAYLGSGETTENLNLALADYTEATTLDKNSHAAYLGLGNVQLALDDAKGAQESYQKAIKLDKSSIPSYLGLSNAFAAAGDLNAALDTLLGAVDAAGESAELTDKITELEAQGAVASGESSNGNGNGNGDGNGGGDTSGNNTDTTDFDVGLVELEISNLDSSFSFDYIEDQKAYMPNAAAWWSISFDVNGPSNVHYLVHAGYGQHAFSAEQFKNIAKDAFWKENPEYLEDHALPFNNYVSVILMEDQLGKDVYCYYLGLDENLNPVAYAVIKDTAPN